MNKMNLPNKLTIFRIFLIPPFILALLGGKAGLFGTDPFFADIVAFFIFVTASLTDLIDGKIARKYNLVTNFGKFMDPLADKLLVCSAMIALVELDRIPAWVVIIIISREFIISGFRLIAANNNVVIAASYWGKWKTVFQMLMVCFMIVNPGRFHGLLQLLTDVLMWVALALTVISLADYVVKNRDVLKEQK